MIAASFYSTVLQHNTTESCLPKNLKYTTAIPVLSFHIISCIFLSTYWIFRPYHFIDEWIGNFINTMIGLVLWVQLATKDESNDSSLYYDVTLIMLNLIRALIFAVYQIFFKYSTLGYYYRFLGFCVLYCCKRHSRKLHRDYMGSERNLSIQSYQDMMYTPSKYWKRSSVYPYLNEIKSQ
uniref:Uncharacterized protein n=1 Tax=Trichobilharzia regenti TaxID=157069 RepID=A0AA85ITZ0_TRIRE|nr:unnamed protein product [Trichobilharzia regenti]